MNNKWRFCSSDQTIQNINSILYTNNLLTVTKWHNKIYDNSLNMHSCSVRLIEEETISTNGKGTTPYDAEASGKAEFLERLQTYSLTQREKDRIYFADEQIMDNKIQSPTLNLYTQEIEYINDFTYGTTGIASGNTYKEAIVHAICELNERYCYWLLVNYQLQIHKKINNSIINSIDFEEYYNGKIYLYDISICDLPTVLLLFIRDNNTIALSIDCAPTLDLAIERCFTELFQGVDLKNKNPTCFSLLTFENCPPKILYYQLVDLKNSIVPITLINYILFFDLSNKKETYKLFNNEFELIETYLKASKKIFDKILIRDYSFLNFPTIKLFYSFNFEESLENYLVDLLAFYSKHFITQNNTAITELFKNNLSYINKRLSWNYQNYNKLRNQLREKSLLFKMDIKYFQQFCLNKNEVD